MKLDSAGVYRDSAGAYRDSAGAYRDSAGAYRDSAGAYRDSADVDHDSAGVYFDSADVKLDSAGLKLDSAGAKMSHRPRTRFPAYARESSSSYELPILYHGLRMSNQLRFNECNSDFGWLDRWAVLPATAPASRAVQKHATVSMLCSIRVKLR